MELLLAHCRPIAHSCLPSLAYRYPHSKIMTRPVTMDPRKAVVDKPSLHHPTPGKLDSEVPSPRAPPGAHSCNPTTHVKPRGGGRSITNPRLAHQITMFPAGSYNTQVVPWMLSPVLSRTNSVPPPHTHTHKVPLILCTPEMRGELLPISFARFSAIQAGCALDLGEMRARDGITRG